MDKLKKALARLSAREQKWVKDIFLRLRFGGSKGLNIKKLQGRVCEILQG